VVDNIIDELPSEFFSIENWTFPKHLSLADPSFNIPQSVDILLGANVFWKVLKSQTVKIKNIASRIFASQFGWLIGGELVEKVNPIYNLVQVENDLSKTIERLWLVDDEPTEKLTFEEMECEEHFVKNYQREDDGRFIVRLPMKIPREELGESRSQALRRFYSLERLLNKNKELKMAYSQGIQDYIDQNHVRLVSDDIPSNKPTYYIPHHVVVKEDSSSTKHRIVLDASAPSTSGLSLNDCLMVGPTVQSDLLSILIRSRMSIYAFSADMSQMYRQVKIHADDSPLLRILWRNDPREEIKTYEFTTVPFGLASSPFLATRSIKALAEIEGERLEAGREALLHDCYVDNIFTGANTLEETLLIWDQISSILESGKFPLKKWCANNEAILEGITPDDLEKKFPFYFGNEHVVKTLGLIWIPSTDEFKIWVHLRNLEKYTKREILSVIASIFDPFGVLAPVTITAKLFMQTLWQSKVKWDDSLNDQLIREWLDFSNQLPSLELISIPRCVICERPSNIEIHGFADASERACGGAVFIRTTTENHMSVHLLCAKTRVAPLKKISIARLELKGAVLLIELVEAVITALSKKWNISIVRLWLDSQIALHWINSSHLRWLPFVANRVKKIHEKQGSAIWDYINTVNNPTDLLSRGINPSELKTKSLRWHGHTFLSEIMRHFLAKLIQTIQTSTSQKASIWKSVGLLSDVQKFIY
jgi:hypothetical protein